MSSDRKFFFHPFYFLSNQTLQMCFNLKWVGKQLRNSYTIGRFLEEITKKKRGLVMVTRGKDKGETGVVKHVIRSQNRLIVEGKNLMSGTFLSCSIIFNFCLVDIWMSLGPKDTPMDLALEKTRDDKTRKGMLDLINLLFNFIGDI
ncbi:unnamed protein product [Camellia sinensis]